MAIGFAPPDGRLIYAALRDQTIELRAVETGKPIGPPLRHTAQVAYITFAADGRTLVCGSAYRSVHLWDVAEGKELVKIGVDDQSVTNAGAVACSNDRSRLAVYTYPFRLTVYDLPSGKCAAH